MPSAFRLLATVLILGISLGAFRSAGAQSASGTKTRSDTVDFSPTGTVEIDNHKGSITVRSWDRAQVGYEMTLAPSDSNSVVSTQPDIDRSDDEISFDHDHAWTINIPGLLTISPDGTDEPVGHFQIVMPKTAALDIGDHASTIDVSDIQGTVNLDTHEGTAQVQNVEGDPTLETFSGSIEATGLRGGADLDTHEGRIIASFEEFAAPSSVDTHSGTVRLFLPASVGFELQLDLDQEDLTVDEAFGTPTSSDDKQRTYNGGGPTLTLDSFSGPVEVRPLEAGSSSAP